MIASDTLFDSRGGFSGSSYPMKTWQPFLAFFIWGARWRHLANTTEPSMFGGDAALCQITLTLVTITVREEKQTMCCVQSKAFWQLSLASTGINTFMSNVDDVDAVSEDECRR